MALSSDRLYMDGSCSPEQVSTELSLGPDNVFTSALPVLRTASGPSTSLISLNYRFLFIYFYLLNFMLLIRNTFAHYSKYYVDLKLNTEQRMYSLFKITVSK